MLAKTAAPGNALIFPAMLLLTSVLFRGHRAADHKQGRGHVVCGRTSADSQPTKLRGVFFWLSAFFEGGEGSTSLEGGNSISCCLIITVIRFWIWGVAAKRNKQQGDKVSHSSRRCLLTAHSLLKPFANCCIQDRWYAREVHLKIL